MKFLIVMGIIMIISFGSFAILLFFQGANTERAKEEGMWDDLQKELSNEYTFRFYGDCGAPKSLEKKFKPYSLSSNAMIGVQKGTISTDVLDFAISKSREPATPRVHGLIFQILKHNLNYDVIDKDNVISFDSQQGDYQLVNSPNQNFAYLLVVDNDFFPVVFDSIGWRAANNTEELMRNNLQLVHKYMDIFCKEMEESI